MKNAVIVIVIIILIAGGYFLFKSQQTQNTTVNQQPVTESQNKMEAAPSTTESMSPAASGAMEQSGAVKEFTVEGKNFSFTPATMTVNKGDKVKITFKNSGGFHDFTLDEFNVKTKQIKDGAEETVAFTADKAGTFEYYCSVGNHRAMGMKGTLTVK